MQPTFKRKTFRDARQILNDLCLMLDGKEASSNRSESETPNPDGVQESWWLDNLSGFDAQRDLVLVGMKATDDLRTWIWSHREAIQRWSTLVGNRARRAD